MLCLVAVQFSSSGPTTVITGGTPTYLRSWTNILSPRHASALAWSVFAALEARPGANCSANSGESCAAAPPLLARCISSAIRPMRMRDYREETLGSVRTTALYLPSMCTKLLCFMVIAVFARDHNSIWAFTFAVAITLYLVRTSSCCLLTFALTFCAFRAHRTD